MRVPFVDLRVQTEARRAELEEAISGVLDRCDFVLGRDVELFEEEFAEYCEAHYPVGVDSGTSAIELALRALGIGAGDEVITQANTFIATALAISQTGATVRLVDAQEETASMDVGLLAASIGPQTRAVVPVHLHGRPVDMDPILELARHHRLAVVEDACQAHGARYKGQRVGSIGDAAAFSFYPSKNLGAAGDGGIVVTGSERIRDAVRMLRNYGQREKYRHETVGFNRRLDTIQAAILRVKLRGLDRANTARQEHATQYRRLLKSADVGLPARPVEVEHVWHLFVVRLADRDALGEFLARADIETGVHYPTPVHLQPVTEICAGPPEAFR